MMNRWVRHTLRITLLALVVAAQSVAHVHAADHGAPPGKTQCPVCTVAQPNGQAAVDCACIVFEPPLDSPVFVAAAPPAGVVPQPELRARAPPLPR